MHKFYYQQIFPLCIQKSKLLHLHQGIIYPTWQQLETLLQTFVNYYLGMMKQLKKIFTFILSQKNQSYILPYNIYQISSYLQEMISDQDKNLIAQISAPGKVIISGQHAVVYGKDALAMAIDLRCKAKIYQYALGEKGSDFLTMTSFSKQYSFAKENIHPQMPDLQQCAEIAKNEGKNSEQIKFEFKISAFANSSALTFPKGKRFHFQIDSQVPVGKCLGSSASFNTVLAAALFFICDPQAPLNLEEVNRVSKILEKVEHGTPSGIDNFVSTYGGLILYNNSKQPQFEKIENQTIIERLNKQFEIFLVDTGKEKNTKKAVDGVRQKCQQEKYRNMIDIIGNFGRQILNSAEKGNNGWKEKVLQILQLNHNLLRELGVSCPEIENIVEKYAIPMKCAVKVTGAGQGGYALVFRNQKGVDEGEILRTKLEKEGLKLKIEG